MIYAVEDRDIQTRTISKCIYRWSLWWKVVSVINTHASTKFVGHAGYLVYMKPLSLYQQIGGIIQRICCDVPFI